MNKRLSETHPSLWNEIMFSDGRVQAACDIAEELRKHTIDKTVLRNVLDSLCLCSDGGLYFGRENNCPTCRAKTRLGLDGE
jgi:hypothetical protein